MHTGDDPDPQIYDDWDDDLFDEEDATSDAQEGEEVNGTAVNSDDDFQDPYAAFLQTAALRRPGVTGNGNQGVQVSAAREERDEVTMDHVQFEYSPKKRTGAQSRSSASSRRPTSWERRSKGWDLLKSGMKSEEELDSAVKEYADEYCKGRGVTPCGKWRGNITQTKQWRCLYHGCSFYLLAEKTVEGGICRFKLMQSSAPCFRHNAHKERDVPSIAVPGEIRALITPLLLAMGPKKMRAHLRKTVLPDGVQVKALLDSRSNSDAEKLRAGLLKLHKQYLEDKRKRFMTEGKGDAFGGLSSILSNLERTTLENGSGIFTEHTVFLLGPPLVVPETGRVTFAVSTENLLLNAYRQTCFGLPPVLAVDTTHRLMTARQYSCMLIGTVSATQHFHIIAYGICSHEDSEAHAYVFRQVFAAVDKVVADRAQSGTRV